MPDKRRSGVRGQRPAVSSRLTALRFLLFGDIVGKIGRRAVAAVMPTLQKRYRPHLIIANAENLAHGLGVTEDSLREMQAAGIDVFTSGNNVWSKDGTRLVASEECLLRPANYPSAAPGTGAVVVEAAGAKVLVLNLQGRVFMNQQLDDPLTTADRLLAKRRQRFAAVLIDMHAEASSEKAALAWHLDGRVSAVVGTHTHVQTADARLLPKGTAFITDLGMCGARDSILGTDRSAVIEHQLTQLSLKHVIPERGEAIVCGLFLEVNPRTRQAVGLKPFAEYVTIGTKEKPSPRKGVTR